MAKTNKLINHPQFQKEKALLLSVLVNSAQSDKLWTMLCEMLTPSEIHMLISRFMISRYLKEGMSAREISAELGVSTTTVIRLSQIIRREGSVLGEILDTINQEEPPVKKVVSEQISTPTTNKYIFGHE